MDKFIPNIEVRTLPNGYSLKFEGMKQSNGYMYFSSEKLLEGFMLHVGLGITDQLNTETMQDFIVTAMNWKDNEKCLKEIENLTACLRAAEKAADVASRKLQDYKDRVKDFTEKLKALAEKRGIAKEMDSVIKNFALGSRRAPLAEDEEDV